MSCCPEWYSFGNDVLIQPHPAKRPTAEDSARVGGRGIAWGGPSSLGSLQQVAAHLRRRVPHVRDVTVVCLRDFEKYIVTAKQTTMTFSAVE